MSDTTNNKPEACCANVEFRLGVVEQKSPNHDPHTETGITDLAKFVWDVDSDEEISAVQLHSSEKISATIDSQATDISKRSNAI